MIPQNYKCELETYFLEKAKIYAQAKFGFSLNLHAYIHEELDLIAKTLVIQLHAHLYGNSVKNNSTTTKHLPPVTSSQTEEHQKIPLSWVDAVKERFFPEWLLKRFPVKYNYITITTNYNILNTVNVTETNVTKYHVCPHIPEEDPLLDHMKFCVPKPKEVAYTP